MNSPIKQVLVSGGTHGNEMSGVQAVSNWLKDSSTITYACPSLNVQFSLINEMAIEQGLRYVDEDLNRQFSHAALSNHQQTIEKTNSLANETSALGHEAALSLSLNDQFGPKSDPSVDFIIDIHNTTSNMGPTLII